MTMPSANAAPDDRCFRQAMRSVAAGMAIIDLQGRWVDVNPALARLLGHDDASALRGQLVSDAFHTDDAERAHAYLTTVAQAAEPANALPQRYRHRAGKVFQARAEVSLVRDDDGAPSCLVMHLHDPTLDDDASALRQVLAETEQTMLALSRQQEVLAHGISHDLRAPLRTIDNFSALLESRNAAALDDAGRDHLQRIRAAAARMGRLIAALMELARVERVDMAHEVVDISMLADWVVADLQDADQGRTVEIDVAPGLHGRGDERLLRILLQQLLDNAWRFSRHGDTVRIQVTGGVADGRLQVAVRDHGCGFDMRYVDKIMEPFQRLHTPEQGAGNGLGLAIASRIIERHGGWLRGQSQDDGGSVFTFELPAADAKTRKSEQAA